MKNKFKYRSDETELLDAPDIPKALLFKNLHELDILNRTLGGHAITIQGIKQLVTDKTKTYHVADLGCGSGDTMKYIADWAMTNGFKVKLTGVDMNADAIEFQQHHCKDYPEISGVVCDYHDFLKKGEIVDIIHCSLFCHHLKDDELSDLLEWVQLKAKTGFIINDLQRNWLAYYSVKVFTFLFNGSPLAKNDGPISVLRGFKKKELKTLLQKAEIDPYSITPKWAFRYLVVGKM